MNNHIKLKAEYIHPSDDLKDYSALSKFRETILFAKGFNVGTYCLYGEKEPETRLLSISKDDGSFYRIIRKQHLLNNYKEPENLSLTQCSALISIMTRNEGSFTQLINSETPESIIGEVTSHTFGWLLWSWQIMGVVSYYLPTVEPNTFINHIHDNSKGAWKLLVETKTEFGISLYELLEKNSLGLKYDTPSFYFGMQLQKLINN